MAFGDEDVAVACGHDAARFGQGMRRISRYTCRADGQQHLAIRTELDYDMALRLFIRVFLALPVVGTSRVDHPDIAVRIHIDLVGKMNMPAPKLFSSFPDESNFMTGATVEPAQLSYANGDSPGGVSGFAPHRFATQTDSPSLSIATAFSAPHVLPREDFPKARWSCTGWEGRLSAGSALPVCVAAAQRHCGNYLRSVTSIGPWPA